MEVLWFHHGCLSVHMSARLWKSGVCTITPLSFYIQWWYFTNMLTLTWGVPLLILGQKVKGQIWILNFFAVSAQQLHFLWHTRMILHRCTDLDLRRTLYFINTRGVEIHAGSFFNFKIWPHPILTKFIHCYYTLSKITYRVIFQFDPTPYQWSLYIVTTRGANSNRDFY